MKAYAGRCAAMDTVLITKSFHEYHKYHHEGGTRNREIAVLSCVIIRSRTVLNSRVLPRIAITNTWFVFGDSDVQPSRR